jgi:fermentation-respiration switch protein FrsA (DUF1100 family)
MSGELSTSRAAPAASTAAPPALRPRWRRWGARALKLSALAYIGLVIVFYLLQTWMIFPGAATQGKAEARVKPAPDEELVQLDTASGEKIYLLFAPALTAQGLPHPGAARRPTILYFYGNAMTISTCYDELYRFRRLGANVAIAEFVGYGLSSGKPSEAGVYATADAAYEYLLTRKDVDAKQLIPAGRSLGGAAAIYLGSRHAVGGVATFSAFSSMVDMGRQVLLWFPTSLLLRHRFENEARVPRIKCPIFLAHGTVDKLVPFAMHARLAKAARSAVTLSPVEGADHNDIFEIGGRKLMEQFGEFVEKVHAARH